MLFVPWGPYRYYVIQSGSRNHAFFSLPFKELKIKDKSKLNRQISQSRKNLIIFFSRDIQDGNYEFLKEYEFIFSMIALWRFEPRRERLEIGNVGKGISIIFSPFTSFRLSRLFSVFVQLVSNWISSKTWVLFSYQGGR